MHPWSLVSVHLACNELLHTVHCHGTRFMPACIGDDLGNAERVELVRSYEVIVVHFA